MTAPHRSRRHRSALVAGSLAAVVSLAGCACCANPPASTAHRAPLHDAQEEFWDALASLCGQSFEGRVVEDSTSSPDFAGKRLVMQVRHCEGDRIQVPFHVGEDRSRTWIFTRTINGIRLKHDHRHEDGAEDELTQYGGDTRGPGSPTTQRFHADYETSRMLPAATTNVWTVEIIPGRTYTYGLERQGADRRFRVEFDLTRPVPAPPAAWGQR
ncbi:MAG: hypothetical protein KF684_07755 [Phycisphaeraceae bacterium]|nr:hypothetical protein [Phycisphaeraceae bacterium]